MYTLLLDPIIGSLCVRWPDSGRYMQRRSACIILLSRVEWIPGFMGWIQKQIGPKPIFLYGHLDFIAFWAQATCLNVAQQKKSWNGFLKCSTVQKKHLKQTLYWLVLLQKQYLCICSLIRLIAFSSQSCKKDKVDPWRQKSGSFWETSFSPIKKIFGKISKQYVLGNFSFKSHKTFDSFDSHFIYLSHASN